MHALLEGIRRRKLVQWLAAYLAGAWVSLEVVDTLAGLWSWPLVVGRAVFVALAVGLFAVAVLAWYHGERGGQRVSGTELLLLASLLLVGGLGVGFVVRRRPPPAVSPAPPDAPVESGAGSLVVLPFADLSPGGDRGYLGDGIAETLINSLARIEALRVVARTSAFQFRGTALDVPAIAKRLGVASVLEGTVAQIGDRVRITADLMDGRSGVAKWSERFDREVDAADLFSLEDDVARRIVDALRVQLGAHEAIVRGGSRSRDAQRAYYLGLHHWTLRTTEDIALAARYFHEAIAADSIYADAWAGLALAYALYTPSEYGVPELPEEEALARSEAAAMEAIRLDSTSAAAYTALGDVYRQQGRREPAERSFRKAIELNPGYATAHHWLADLLMQSLDGEGGLAEIDVAESMDPVAPAILAEKAQALMMLGRYAEAEAYLDHALDLQPDAPVLRAWAALFFEVMGRWDRAAEQFESILAAEGQDPVAGAKVVSSLRDPDGRTALLRLIADGRFAETGLEGHPGADSMAGVPFRFVALRTLDGDDRAMAFLEEEARGPDAKSIYVPLLPALMGPELAGSPRGRSLMESLARR